MSEYDNCIRGTLKLKGNVTKKKKQKDSKKKETKFVDQVVNLVDVQEIKDKSNKEQMKLTKAEIAFIKQQEKLQKEQIMKKASMTHKQRVEQFNRHLDSLTEHFDIPKVSWTK